MSVVFCGYTLDLTVFLIIGEASRQRRLAIASILLYIVTTTMDYYEIIKANTEPYLVILNYKDSAYAYGHLFE